MSHQHAPASSPRLRIAGIDAATIEARDGDGYTVRLSNGELAPATLGRGVKRALADECLREGRTVLLCWQGDDAVLLGALQTDASAVTLRDGVVTLAGDEVRLEATQRVQLEAGASRIVLTDNGKLHIWGERLTMHIASLIKLVASKVELP